MERRGATWRELPVLSARAVWWVLALLATVVVVDASFLVGSHQLHQARFEGFDEVAHYDYVIELGRGHVPVYGDRYDQQTLRAVSCLGQGNVLAGTASRPGGCAVKVRNPRAVPPDGYQYEAQQPPLGYLPYLLFAHPREAPRRALIDARRGGELWTVVAAALLLLLCRVERFRVSQVVLVQTLALLGPVAVFASATVTNDSGAVAGGALAALVIRQGQRRRRRFAALGFLVGLLVALIKGPLAVVPLVFVVAGVYEEVTRSTWRNLRAVGRRQASAISMLVGAAISGIGWQVFQDAQARVSPATVQAALLAFRHTGELDWSTITTSVSNQFTLLTSYRPAALYDLWDLASFGALAGVALLHGAAPNGTRRRALAIGTVIGLVLLGAAVTVDLTIQGGYDLAAPPRYALPILPVVGVVLARSLRRSGLVLVGVALPLAAVITQLAIGVGAT